MPYATESQFITAFTRDEAVSLTNLDDPSVEDVNSVALDRALTDASEEIDSYLAGRYTLPLTAVPKVLIGKCLDIARYRLDTVRQRDDVRQRYDDAIKFLTLISKGSISLGLDSQNQPTPQASTGMPEFVSTPRTFDFRGFG
jgi:phage gp36-like protein